MRQFFTFLLCIAISGIAFTQKTMTPELLWKLNRVGGVLVAPDYSKAVYKVTSYDVDKNSGSSIQKMLEVKSGKKQTLETKGKVIAWYSSKEVLIQDGLNLKIYHLEDKTSKDFAKIPEGASGVELSNDKQHLLFIKDVKLDGTVQEKHKDLPKSNARVIDDLMYRHWDSWHDYAYSHIFVMSAKDGSFANAKAIDIMPNERFDSPLNPFGGMEQITFSSDSKSIVYTCKKLSGKDYAVSTNSDLYQYDLASGKTSNLTKGNEGYDTNPTFASTGRMAYLRMKRNGFESDKNNIVYVESDGTHLVLTEDLDMTISDFVFNNKGNYIYFKSVKEGCYQLFELEIATKKVKQITMSQTNYSSLAFAGKYLIGTRQDMNHPNEVFRVSISNGDQKQMTYENKAIFDELELCDVKKKWITTTDGKKMLTWVIYPPNFDRNKKYPTLLYCQGGPQSAVSQFYSFRWNFQLMASQGYIVVAPNRRGLPGFGREWNDAISKDWGGQPMDDYLSAIDSVAKEPYVDENKLGAVGASYGGYSVYYLAGMHNKRFKTFISHCGLFNLESWYGTTEELFFANWDIGGPYWKKENKELYLKNSPHKMVDKWDTPILVIHGGKDYRVPLGEGMQAFQAAQLKGIPSKFLYFPEESHWVLSPQNGLVWHREYFEWLDKWLK